MKKFILSLSIVLLSIILFSISCLAQTHISTEAELRTFASAVNAGTTYEGQTVILDNDIALTAEWTPIGKSGKSFKGTFEGNGHKISNLNTVNQDYAGLFGYINGGTIQNITVYGNISISGKKRIGGVCGLMQNNSKIENCHFIGQIYANTSGDTYVGGVVGEILEGGTLNKCSSTGLIYGETDKAKCIGGIVGRSGKETNPNPIQSQDINYHITKITNCINLADVYGLSSVGGIIAYAGLNITIENCLNCGNINGFTPSNGNKYYGGIVGGYYFGMRVYNCLSTSTVNNNKPSAVIGVVTQSNFPDTCPKVNVYYDYQRMYLNHSRHGISAYTSEIIDGSLSSTFTGWIFDGGYPYPKEFTYDSVIMVAKSYVKFSNNEEYDNIISNFKVSDFNNVVWTSRQNRLSIRTTDIVPLSIGKDTLTVQYGSYYKNILLNIESYDPLPITLRYFNATPRSDGKNLLKWVTAYESQNSNFEICRTRDILSNQWEPVVTLWQGTTDKPYGASYQWLDEQPYDTTYYMLVQNDLDGGFETFRSEMVVCIQEHKTTFDEPYVICDNGPQVIAGSEVCEVFVQNVLGQIVEEFSLEPYQQREVLAEIQGMYLITFVYKYNGETRKKTEKIICM